MREKKTGLGFFYLKKHTSQLFIMILILVVLAPGCKHEQEEQTMETPEKLSIQANLVFLYYKDLASAQSFYEEILGLELVIDYGFAKLFRISLTSYVGLVDETEGMHGSSEPKTVTLSFVTQEIDDWYNYLEGKGVKMHRPLGDATRHPTRGFVALDPEDYFLEFETFLEHPQNEKLLPELKKSEAVYRPSSRPENLGIQANVLWLYYNNLEKAQDFYENVLGLELLVDQGFAKVYFSSPTGFIGLVDGAEGLHSATEEKAVTVSFLTGQIDEWFQSIEEKGLEIRTPLSNLHDDLVRVFVTYDCEGYFLEFDKFLPHEKNTKILNYLNK